MEPYSPSPSRELSMESDSHTEKGCAEDSDFAEETGDCTPQQSEMEGTPFLFLSSRTDTHDLRSYNFII